MTEYFVRELEYFNVFCSHLGRREDKADKEDLRSDIEISRANLMRSAEAATGIKRTRKIKLLWYDIPTILAIAATLKDLLGPEDKILG